MGDVVVGEKNWGEGGNRMLEESPRQKEEHVQGTELGVGRELKEGRCLSFLGLP